VIKLYFELNDPRAAREIDIEKNIRIDYVPKIYDTGFLEYEDLKTLYVVEEKIEGIELRDILNSGTSLTRTEALLGPHTPGYAAPEQFNNLKREIDSRADLFSLAVVTYECLTGDNPFRKNAINA
jgi:serine/threonine-protein kinase